LQPKAILHALRKSCWWSNGC